MKKENKRILKFIVSIVLLMNSSLAFTSTHKSDRDPDIYNDLVGSLNETFSRIKTEEEVVENHEVIRVYLINEKGKIACQAAPQGLTASFMKSSVNESEGIENVGALPECNQGQLAQIQNQAQYASLGHYGANKVAVDPLTAYATYAIAACAVGAVVGITDDLTDDKVNADGTTPIYTMINNFILTQEEQSSAMSAFKVTMTIGGFLGPAASAGLNFFSGGIIYTTETVKPEEEIQAHLGAFALRVLWALL